MTYRDSNCSKVDRNIIFKIEENTLFCQKFVLCYTDDEMKELTSYIRDTPILQILNDIVMSKDMFKIYKCNKNSTDSTKNICKLYSIVSRIFIKIPLMMLTNIEPLNNGLSFYTAENVNKLKKGLFERLCSEKMSIEETYFNDTVEMVDLTDKELREIEKELIKVGGFNAK